MSNRKKFSQILAAGNGIAISVIILAAFLIVAAICVPKVFSPVNIANVMKVYAPVGIMALGFSMVALCGEFDISIAGIMALSMTIGSLFIEQNEYLAFFIIVLIGALCGFLNGVLVTKTRVPSLIITIGMSLVYRGLADIIVSGQYKYITEKHVVTTQIAKESILGIPIPFFIFIIVFLALWFITSKTSFGKNLYYTGSNSRAAWLSGIHIYRVKTIAFTICGVCAALTCIPLMGQVGMAFNGITNNYATDALAIAVLGGISLTGGRGSIAGAFCGALTMSVLLNMLSLSGLGTFIEIMSKGILIIAVLYLFGFINRKIGITKEG